MALKIRLALGGAKKRPFYKIVVADSRKARDGRFVEKLGTYDPFLTSDDPARVIANEERARYWISVGAQVSERCALLLSQRGLCKKPAVRETPKKSAPKRKAQERLKAQQDAASLADQK